jgi:tight adherence protein B
VQGLAVTPLATANQGDFGVMLVIDASQSMAGAPIRQAMLAAQTLAAQRSGRQEIGVIEFNSTSRQVLPLTSNAASINAALSHTPELAFGTHIYDATRLAIEQLHASGVAAGSVIVLSDGADVGSTVTQQTVASAAAGDHVRVYTVGVDDRDFDPSTLRGLARASFGSYTSSSVAGLRQVFSTIESQLRSRYLVRYRSTQPGGHRISVALWVAGVPGVWTGRYASPAPPVPPARPRSHAGSTPFWTSSVAVVIVAFMCAVLLVGGLLAYLVPLSRHHGLRQRISAFTQESEVDQVDPVPTRSGLAERVDTWMHRFARWPRFSEEVEVGAIERSAAEILLMTVMATLLSAVLVAVVSGIALTSLPILLLGPVVMVAVVRARAERQRRLFSDQLAGHLEEIGSAMRAGHSVIASVSAMADDAVDPARREFQRAIADEQLGVPLEAALRPIARRMKCADIEQLALVAGLNQRTGSNMAAVLDVIADGVRERAELRRELDALTAQARLSRWIVSCLPFGILALLAVIRPAYVAPLFNTTGGAIALTIAVVLVILGSLVMRMIVAPQE